MIDAALPAAMAFAALGLVLGFARVRIAALALGFAAVVATGASVVPMPDTVVVGGWIGIIAVALAVWLVRSVAAPFALLLGAVAGLCAGLIVAATGDSGDLVRALPAGLIVVPASFAVARGHAVVPRVVAGWLIAVALLAAILPHVVSHPGYVPDHRG